MEELVELLLELAVERPAAGIAVLMLSLSLVCFIFTGSVVPIVAGLLAALWVHRRISRRCGITLDPSESRVARIEPQS